MNGFTALGLQSFNKNSVLLLNSEALKKKRNYKLYVNEEATNFSRKEGRKNLGKSYSIWGKNNLKWVFLTIGFLELVSKNLRNRRMQTKRKLPWNTETVRMTEMCGLHVLLLFLIPQFLLNPPKPGFHLIICGRSQICSLLFTLFCLSRFGQWKSWQKIRLVSLTVAQSPLSFQVL